MNNIHGFSKKKILDIYKSMYLSRQLDEKLFYLSSNQKLFSSISSSGFEGCQIAAANNLIPSEDWSYLSNRDLAFSIGIGVDLKKILIKFISDSKRINNHNYYNFKIINKGSFLDPVILPSIGSAISSINENSNQVVYLSIDFKDMLKGEFFETIQCSCLKKLPIIFHIQKSKNLDLNDQNMLNNISGFENLFTVNIDGVNFFESNLAFQKSVERARMGNGPSVIISNAFSLASHFSSNAKEYDYNKITESNFDNDPLLKLKTNITDFDICDINEFSYLENKIDQDIDNNIDLIEQNLFDDDLDFKEKSNNISFNFDSTKNTIDQKINFSQSIYNALFEEFLENEKLLLCYSKIDKDQQKINNRLKKKYSNKRVISLPINSSSLIGACIGFSISGYKPIVKLTSLKDLYSSLKYLNFLFTNQSFLNIPMVLRVPLKDFSNLNDSENLMLNPGILNIPNIKIVYPSNAEDGKGLLKMSCRSNSFVIFFENEKLYQSESSISIEPDENYLHPFGKSSVKKEGKDITFLTYGLMVHKTLEVANILENDFNVDCEVIDLKCLKPLDLNLIEQSIKKSNKIIIIHEELLDQGPGSQLSTIISESFFEYLDGPIIRIGSKVELLEDSSKYIFPKKEEIIQIVTKLTKY